MHPYLFTQSQAIFARTLFPCQDSPSVKSTFECTLKCPLPAYTSGVSTGSSQGTYSYEQTVPIPSYLFAIVAGNLSEVHVSDRCSIITEPEKMDLCKQELSEMEEFLQGLENYT